jgi:hypothetical protein
VALIPERQPFLPKISSKIAIFGGLDPVSLLVELLCDLMILPLTFDMLPLEN